GGTPRGATAGHSQVLDRQLTVRFDANVAGGLPWRFEPEQNSIEVKVGEVVTVGYRVVNESARETVGVASYNVSPSTAGAYFSKINCFCFTDQRLKAGEKRDMTVVFFAAPELRKESAQVGLGTLPLLFDMYPAGQAEPPQVDGGAAPAPGRS